MFNVYLILSTCFISELFFTALVMLPTCFTSMINWLVTKHKKTKEVIVNRFATLNWLVSKLKTLSTFTFDCFATVLTWTITLPSYRSFQLDYSFFWFYPRIANNPMFILYTFLILCQLFILFFAFCNCQFPLCIDLCNKKKTNTKASLFRLTSVMKDFSFHTSLLYTFLNYCQYFL